MNAEELRPVAEYLQTRALAEANEATKWPVGSGKSDTVRSYYLDRAAELDALADLVERAMGEGVVP